MLDLLQKVDSSRDNSSTACSGSSDNNREVRAAVESVSHPHQHQASAFAGFGLQLPLPSQGKQLPNHDLHAQTSLYVSSRRQLDSEAGAKDRMQSASRGLDHHLHYALEGQRKGDLDGRSDSKQAFNERPQLISQGNTSTNSASHLSHMGRQLQPQKQQQLLQQQHISGLTRHEAVTKSGNLVSRSQAALEENIQHASLLRQAQVLHDIALASHSGQTLLPSMAGKILPFKLDPSPDAHGPGSEVNYSDRQPSFSTNSGLYKRKSTVQQAETGETFQARVQSGISQHIGFSTMSQNVWTNAAAQKILASSQPQNCTPNITQSIVLSASSGEKSSGAVQMDDVRGNEGRSAQSEFATCSSNSQQFIDAGKMPAKEDSLQGADSERGDSILRTGGFSQEEAQLPKHQLDKSSTFSVSSVGHLPHYDINRGKLWPNAPASSSEAVLYGYTVLPTKAQHPNYSLLQQMQTTRVADSDAVGRDGKRPQGESCLDTSQTQWQAGQGYTHGQTVGPMVLSPPELGASSSINFPSDVKMLSFSSSEDEEKNADRSAPLVGREGSSLDTCLPGHLDLQRLAQQFTSTAHFVGRGEHPLLTPQMTRAWFEQYRKHKNSQILAMYAHQKNAQVSSQQFPAERSSKIDNAVLAEQRIEMNQFSALSQSMPACDRTIVESSHLLPFVVTGHDVVIRSKKQKTATPHLLPWHQVVSFGVQRLQSTRWHTLSN